MAANHSLWIYFAQAGIVVKLVMLMLLVTSVVSWSLIIQRSLYLKKVRTEVQDFEDHFWSGTDLAKLYSDINQDEQYEGLKTIFSDGFREFVRLRRHDNPPEMVMEGVQRAMRIAHAREVDKLEQHLPFLASVGSTSPYVGLFGTVWGIMTSFHALGAVQQATIAMVAPGISEALIATAMGLFAAIPAVLAYNHYSTTVDRLINQFSTFQEEFTSILHRQAHVAQEG